jgi:GT2 family glycosyltransferase
MKAIKIAVLLTCFNRKEKTIACLKQLVIALNNVEETISLKIYLTDDGSTDGTGEAVKLEFPEVQVLKGNGNLFWAGGMRNSWSEALKDEFDMFFLLNDDTILYPNVFNQLIEAREKAVNTYQQDGIYLGATEDPINKKNTYGGAVLLNKLTLKYKHLNPNGNLQHVDLGNANIMFVSKNVVNQIGILSKDYIHGVADYDYTLRAVKKNIPVLLMPETCGSCINDHEDSYSKFSKKTFSERKKYLMHPLGLDFKSNFNLTKNHFSIRIPLVILGAGIKLFFANLYLKLSKAR